MKPPLSVSTHWIWEVQSKPMRADLAILTAIEAQEGSANGEIPLVTRSQLKRLIQEGRVQINGNPLKANTLLKSGAVIHIEFPPPLPSSLIPENKPIHILYEDEHLLVVNKPPGMTVHPSSTQMEGTLVHVLLHHIRDLSGIGGILRPGIVHRIDKNTSGALVISKTDLAHTQLALIFSKHQIERCYWALCYGSPPALSDFTKIESLLGRSPTDRKKMSMKVKEGRKAITYFKRIEEYALPRRNAFASCIETTLETGRTHQVRVHLAGIGYSILGDPTYGTPTANHTKWQALPENVQKAVQELPGQALHAKILGFKHPISGKNLRFEAQPPASFERVLQECKKFS